MTPSAPRSNWRWTVATHCSGEPIGRRRQPRRRDQRGDVLQLLGRRRLVDGAPVAGDERVGPERAPAAPGPSRSSTTMQVAVGLQVGGHPPDRLLQRTGSGRWSPIVARHDHTSTVAGSRPACSAASLTVRTQRTSVSSSKNVCSTTWSKARPARRRVFGPNAVMPSGMSSSNAGSRRRNGYAPAGTVVADDRLAVPQPAHQPGEVLELGGRDRRQAEGGGHRADAAAEAEREPSAGQAVHRRGVRRGDDRVAGVVVGRRGGDVQRRRDRADRARQRGRLLDVEALRDEHPAEAEPLAVGDLRDQVARRLGRAGQRVEAELLECHGRRLPHRAWDDRPVPDVLDPAIVDLDRGPPDPTGLDGSAGAGGETGEEFRAAEVARFEQLGRR